MLSLVNCTKKYGNKTALDSVNVTFENGVYGLLGSNGAGKSTMLNLITDNIPRTSGQILYNGTDILSLGRKFRKKLGYTPQLQGMYEDFTARDFLHYIGALKGMKRKDCREQTEHFLEIVSLSEEAHHKLGSFSGGMRQRVLLAAAMLDEPEILILDEPTAGLDPTQRIRLREYIASMAEHRTVLLATHVIGDIESVAKKVLILHHGTVSRFASVPELLSETEQALAKEQVENAAGYRGKPITLEDVYLYLSKEKLSESEN